VDTYTELMARRELLASKWLEIVAESKTRGVRVEDLWSVGVVVDKRGALRMPVQEYGRYAYDLELGPGETAVRKVTAFGVRTTL
jgi:hypothetical protein